MEPRDRKSQLLLPGATWNGIDFVEVVDDAQTMLRVHFINSVALQSPVEVPTITGGESIPTVTANPAMTWGTDGNHVVLDLTVAAPGDFTLYTLAISTDSPNLDPFFSSVTFSFKARCPSNLDCQTAAPACPPSQVDTTSIDYLAKDFLSFRRALLDFSSLNYPQWQERSEADFGVMFAEALSALADDLSYTQDRIAAEAVLATLTQRRSLVRLARMVDYEPGRATAARVNLQFTVETGVVSINHGLAMYATGPDGTPIVFETGIGLLDVMIDPDTGLPRSTPPTTPANPLWNPGTIQPYWLDDSERCLPAGATGMLVLGHGFGFQMGVQLLIETQGATSADPPIRQIVTLTSASDSSHEFCDRVFLSTVTAPGPLILTCGDSAVGATAPTAYTQITWQEPLLFNRDLTVTTLSGNIVPATQGQTIGVMTPETFAINMSPAGSPQAPLAIVRTGPRPLPIPGNCATPDPSPQFLYCLNVSPLAWLVPLADSTGILLQTDPDAGPDPQPEILLQQLNGVASTWTYLQSMLEAEQFGSAFTLDPATYKPICTNSDGTLQYEYTGDTGDTIRFGDGTFGRIPADATLFRVIYRIGGGASGNVAAGAINQIKAGPGTQGLQSVTNPLPGMGGADQESSRSVQRLAPQQFQAVQYRAVIPQDYQDAAEKLSWVDRAGTTFRWTGSWLTVFTTPDPVLTELPSTDQQTDLIKLLNRYRMAGYESYVPTPQYASLDIQIQVCAMPASFRADVESAVLSRLNPSRVSGTLSGFFNHTNFTFGQPLELSRLQSAVQGASGVAGVQSVTYRVRGKSQGYVSMPDEVTVGAAQIIRCDNDPSVPEHGSIQVTVLGGK